MNAQDFWHGIALILGLAGFFYALFAREFRRTRLFTTGPEERFKPTWFDRFWLAGIALFFLSRLSSSSFADLGNLAG